VLDRRAVQRVLEERVIPLVRADGGEIELVDVLEDGLVRVRMLRACSGCPGVQFTVGGLVARELRAAVQGFRDVEVVLP
jgi:Fe-S cluster biogenesis protein NfuA